MTFLQFQWWTNGPSRDKKKTERFECSTGCGALHGGAHVAMIELLYRGWRAGENSGFTMLRGDGGGISCASRAVVSRFGAPNSPRRLHKGCGGRDCKRWT